MLPNPAHGRYAITAAGGNFHGAFALVIELQDAFPHRHRNGFHAQTFAFFHNM
jgi:hypothetical protein